MNTNKGVGSVGVVIVILVLIAGGFYLLKGSGGETPSSGDVSENLETSVPGTGGEETGETLGGEIWPVAYDENGFSPSPITVKIGDTVIFENLTGNKASVASDDHPTHLLYPEFDQYKTDQRGEDQFSFTFTEVGTWGYHDHLNADMVGTVIVTE